MRERERETDRERESVEREREDEGGGSQQQQEQEQEQEQEQQQPHKKTDTFTNERSKLPTLVSIKCRIMSYIKHPAPTPGKKATGGFSSRLPCASPGRYQYTKQPLVCRA
jgi:hypothetical protein